MRQPPHGFTLIELLVAMFITAVLFAIGYGALDQAMRSRGTVERQAARLTAVQRALRLMEQDFELLQPRAIRDPGGSGYQPALLTGATAGVGAAAGDLPIVTFTRGGWSNPAGVARSELQRVAYVLRDHQLVRQYWAVLDPAPGSTPRQRVLLDEVEALSLRYMNAGHQWQSGWPPPGVGGTDLRRQRMRPVAVEITLELRDWGQLVRIVEVAG
ncbi:MAG: type II secretion system minor pseudopilin GspJ [Gammaproteobacteria bacterium]|nr:type II secretion system minor pseudopilin GspJ [Gammaproteobacteria bacterium]